MVPSHDPPPTPHKYRTKATSEHGGVVVGTRGSLVARRGANNARAHPAAAAAAADPATGLDERGLSAANAGTPHTPSRRDTPSLGDDSPPPLRCSPIMMTTTTTMMRHNNNNNNNNGGTHCRSSCLAGDNADGPCAAGKRSSQQIAMTAQGGVALPEVRRPRTRCGGWCRKKKKKQPTWVLRDHRVRVLPAPPLTDRPTRAAWVPAPRRKR